MSWVDWFTGQPGQSANDAMGPYIQQEIKLFCGFSGKLLAGIETSLICQRRNYAGFKRISWIFPGKWTVFLRIDGESGGEMRADFAVSIAVDAVYKPFFS